MVMSINDAPVVIRRKKVKVKGNAPHHGGAWKVAYADFVTAMMAFFLMMWLLNSTTEQQRQGIADYFSPTIALNRMSGGGDGLMGGSSLHSEEVLAKLGEGGLPTDLTGVGLPNDKEQARLSEIQDMLVGGGGESFLDDNLRKHVVTKLTDRGLVIELFASEQTPLFVEGKDAPYRIMADLVRAVTRAANLVTNQISVEAHLRSELSVVRDPIGWTLSSDRANTTRRMLETQGIEPTRIVRVTGHSDRDKVSANPRDMRNNRIEVILLRSDRR